MSLAIRAAGMAAGRKMAIANPSVAIQLRHHANEHFDNWTCLRDGLFGENLDDDDQAILSFFNRFWPSREGWPIDGDEDDQELFVEAFFDGLSEAVGAPN